MTFQSCFMSTTVQPLPLPRRGLCPGGPPRTAGRTPIRARHRCGGRKARISGPARQRSIAAFAGRRQSCRTRQLAGGRCAGGCPRAFHPCRRRSSIPAIAPGPAYRRVFQPCLDTATDDLLRWDAIDPLCKRTHELNTAARHDEGPKAVGAQIREHLKHRLIDHLGVKPLRRRMLRGGAPSLHKPSRTPPWSWRRGWPSQFRAWHVHRPQVRLSRRP